MIETNEQSINSFYCCLQYGILYSSDTEFSYCSGDFGKNAYPMRDHAMPLFSLSNYFGNRKNIRSRVNSKSQMFPYENKNYITCALS